MTVLRIVLALLVALSASVACGVRGDPRAPARPAAGDPNQPPQPGYPPAGTGWQRSPSYRPDAGLEPEELLEQDAGTP